MTNKNLEAPKVLREAADLFETRATMYKANYRQAATIMQILFPDGINLGDDEMRIMRYQFLEHIVNKLTRYANNFDTGGHSDSSFDSIVYWAMLHATDEENKT